MSLPHSSSSGFSKNRDTRIVIASSSNLGYGDDDVVSRSRRAVPSYSKSDNDESHWTSVGRKSAKRRENESPLNDAFDKPSVKKRRHFGETSESQRASSSAERREDRFQETFSREPVSKSPFSSSERDEIETVSAPLLSIDAMSSSAVKDMSPNTKAQPRLKNLAEFMFSVKISALPVDSFAQILHEALKRENLKFSKNMNFDKNSQICQVDMFAEDVLIGRGEGRGPSEAERNAAESVVTNARCSDYVSISDTITGKKVRFNSKENFAPVGSFRYDLLCRERSVYKSSLPLCSHCNARGHTYFFCFSWQAMGVPLLVEDDVETSAANELVEVKVPHRSRSSLIDTAVTQKHPKGDFLKEYVPLTPPVHECNLILICGLNRKFREKDLSKASEEEKLIADIMFTIKIRLIRFASTGCLFGEFGSAENLIYSAAEKHKAKIELDYKCVDGNREMILFIDKVQVMRKIFTKDSVSSSEEETKRIFFEEVIQKLSTSDYIMCTNSVCYLLENSVGSTNGGIFYRYDILCQKRYEVKHVPLKINNSKIANHQTMGVDNVIGGDSFKSPSGDTDQPVIQGGLYKGRKLLPVKENTRPEEDLINWQNLAEWQLIFELERAFANLIGCMKRQFAFLLECSLDGNEYEKSLRKVYLFNQLKKVFVDILTELELSYSILPVFNNELCHLKINNILILSRVIPEQMRKNMKYIENEVLIHCVCLFVSSDYLKINLRNGVKSLRLYNCQTATNTNAYKFEHILSLPMEKLACGLCGGDHLIEACSEFISFTSLQRLQFVEKLKLCKKCLLFHLETFCSKQTKCFHDNCYQEHHSFLHESEIIFGNYSCREKEPFKECSPVNQTSCPLLFLNTKGPEVLGSEFSKNELQKVSAEECSFAQLIKLIREEFPFLIDSHSYGFEFCLKYLNTKYDPVYVIKKFCELLEQNKMKLTVTKSSNNPFSHIDEELTSENCGDSAFNLIFLNQVLVFKSCIDAENGKSFYAKIIVKLGLSDYLAVDSVSEYSVLRLMKTYKTALHGRKLYRYDILCKLNKNLSFNETAEHTVPDYPLFAVNINGPLVAGLNNEDVVAASNLETSFASLLAKLKRKFWSVLNSCSVDQYKETLERKLSRSEIYSAFQTILPTNFTFRYQLSSVVIKNEKNSESRWLFYLNDVLVGLENGTSNTDEAKLDFIITFICNSFKSDYLRITSVRGSPQLWLFSSFDSPHSFGSFRYDSLCRSALIREKALENLKKPDSDKLSIREKARQIYENQMKKKDIEAEMIESKLEETFDCLPNQEDTEDKKVNTSKCKSEVSSIYAPSSTQIVTSPFMSFYCHLCKIDCHDSVRYNVHINDPEHLRQVALDQKRKEEMEMLRVQNENLRQQLLSSSNSLISRPKAEIAKKSDSELYVRRATNLPVNRNPPMSPSARRKQNEEDRINFCDVCVLQFVGPEPYAKHLDSLRHFKKVAVETPEIGEYQKNCAGHLHAQFFCDVCRLPCETAPLYESHVFSVRHKEKETATLEKRARMEKMAQEFLPGPKTKHLALPMCHATDPKKTLADRTESSNLERRLAETMLTLKLFYSEVISTFTGPITDQILKNVKVKDARPNPTILLVDALSQQSLSLEVVLKRERSPMQGLFRRLHVVAVSEKPVGCVVTLVPPKMISDQELGRENFTSDDVDETHAADIKAKGVLSALGALVRCDFLKVLPTTLSSWEQGPVFKLMLTESQGPKPGNSFRYDTLCDPRFDDIGSANPPENVDSTPT